MCNAVVCYKCGRELAENEYHKITVMGDVCLPCCGEKQRFYVESKKVA